MKRDYHVKRRKREPLVRCLLGLGMRTSDIAALAECSKATISSDFQRLGGKAAFPFRPSNQEEVFARILGAYANMCVYGITHDQLGPMSAEHQELATALASWLGEQALIDFIRGVHLSMQHLRYHHYERKRWARLLAAIVGDATLFTENPCEQDRVAEQARETWKGFLQEIRTHAVRVPTSTFELETALLRRVHAEKRESIVVYWDETVFSFLKTLLEGQAERSQKILDLRYGLSEKEPISLAEAGKALGISRERVRQLEVRTLRELRASLRQQGLWNAISRPMANTLGDMIKEEEGHVRVQRLFPTDEYDRKLLAPIAKLGLKNTTTQHLFVENITLVGQLVQRSIRDLLRTPNLGIASIREIEERLACFGDFELGTVLAKPVREAVEYRAQGCAV